MLRQRTLILDLDVCDGAGNSLTVVTGDVNTYMAECILLSQAFPTGGFDKNQHLFLRLSFDLFRSIRDGNMRVFEGVDHDVRSMVLRHDDSAGNLSPHDESQFEYYVLIQRFLASIDAEDLNSLMLNHIFAVNGNCLDRQGEQIIKCRFVYRRGFNVDKFQFGRAIYNHRVTQIETLDSRYHIRVEVPTGMRIASFSLRDLTEDAEFDKRGLRIAATTQFLAIRLNGDMVRNGSKVWLDVAYTPKRSALIIPAACLAAVYILVCIVLIRVSVPYAAYGGVATVIAALLTVAGSILLGNSEEHDITKKASNPTRSATIALATLVFILSFVFALNPDAWIVVPIAALTIVLNVIFLMSGLISIVRIGWYNQRYKDDSLGYF